MRYLYLAFILLFIAATSLGANPGDPANAARRTGDEIVICGQLFHTGTPVVLFSDPGGYDGSRFSAGPVTRPSATGGVETIRGGNISLDQLRQHVDQFVLHFDACGISSECFHVLQRRRLSVQFMCDLDGTIYQTTDAREDDYHATIANARSVGVEIANLGGFDPDKTPPLIKQWYLQQGSQTRITIPEKFGDRPLHTPRFIPRPARPDPIRGVIQGHIQRQYDFTPQQYNSLCHLAATLCTVLPKIQLNYPRQKSTLGIPTTGPATQPSSGDPSTRAAALAEPEEAGLLIPHALTREQFDSYQGILGHYHIQTNKTDPGPAFQWAMFITRTRNLMTPAARAANAAERHQPARSAQLHTIHQPATEPAEQP